MFIELIDVGIAHDANGMATGIDATAPEHGSQFYLTWIALFTLGQSF